MFKSLVVALDLESSGDRALPVVRALAELGDAPVEQLTVSSPNVAEDTDVFELRRRAVANGWPVDSFAIVHSDDVAAAIVEYVERRDALLVMATSAKAPWTRRLLGSVSEAVLGATRRPVLVVGPRVPVDVELRRPTLIACIDATEASDAAVPAIGAWTRTFGGNEPWIAEVVPGPTTRAEVAQLTGCAHARHYSEVLAADGVQASYELLHGRDPVTLLLGFADHVADPILVATSTRWIGGRRHSVTRELVLRSSRPVLVVPARDGRRPPFAPQSSDVRGAPCLL